MNSAAQRKNEALTFLSGLDHCVISSVDAQDKPESALVAFSVTAELEVIIGTSKKSRKFQNIQANPSVSIVFFDLAKKQSLQYEGTARELSQSEKDKKKPQHFRKHEGAKKYESDPSQTYILVKPQWARYVETGPVIHWELREF